MTKRNLKQPKPTGGTSTHRNNLVNLLLRTLLLAVMVCGAGNVAWGQDATFNMGVFSTDITENECTLKFTGGGIEDVNTETGVTTLSTKTENGNKTSASMTLTGENIRYIKITFADDENTYNLKWGDSWNETIDANNAVSGKGTLVLVSNSGPNYFKIINDTEKGTESTPIKKVEVYYWNDGYSATGDQTAEKATKTISNAITWKNNTVDPSMINVVGTYASFGRNHKGAMLKNSGDSYLSIKFDKPADLSGISYFRIDGENVDKTKNPHVFDLAQFICDDGNGGTVNVDKYNNPANVDFTGNDNADQRAKLARVKEIRLYNNNCEGTFSINSIKFIYQYTLTWINNEIPTGCDAWYTIGSDETHFTATSKVIEAGTEVTFHGTDTGDDHKMINGWYNPNGEYWGWGATKAITVSSDFSVKPDFQPCFRVFANAENGATATVNKTGKFFQEVDGLTFSTTVPDGYTFDGWYNGASRLSGDNPYSYGTYQPGDGVTDLTLTAKFKVALKTIGKPECNHYGSRTHGDNYFNIQQLNPAEGVTLGEYSSETGRTVTVPTTGGYMSFAFENGYNLSDLVKWTISDNPDLRARVSNVEFIDANGNTVSNCWTNAGDRQNVGSDVQSKLNNVKEIRIHFKESDGDDAIDYRIKWICFSFEHSDRTLPTLKNGTEKEMEIYETTSLVISNTPGYWRQYTDDTYGTIKTADNGGLIPGGQWETYYKFDNMQRGDYYFGARDGGTCALGYTHQTELVKVHVNVKALDIYGDIVTTKGNEHSVSYDGEKNELALSFSGTLQNKTEDVVVTINVNKTLNNFPETHPGIKLYRDKGTELIVNAPNGYRVQKVDITFGHDTKYNVSMNRGNAILQNTGNSITYTNLSEYDYVRMVVCNDATEDEKEVHVTNVKVYLVPVNVRFIDESRTVTFKAAHGANKDDDITRDYWIYVPNSIYGEESHETEYPVVFSLHGTGNDYLPTNGGVQNYNELAETNKFIVVYPRGRELKFIGFNGGATSVRGWEATGVENEDTDYLLAIANALVAENSKDNKQFKVNQNQIYLTGFSNGGMMAYACANATSHKFAAYASVSGFPMNEMHHQHNGPRAIPFMHIHGKADDFVKYKYVPTIVDNMLVRNGLPYTPTTTTNGSGYKYSAWIADGKQPFYLYEIDGMGHNSECTIGSKNSKEVIWDFFRSTSLPAETASRFAPVVRTYDTKVGPEDWRWDNMISTAREHGWTINDGLVLAKYGESGGYDAKGENTYHSLQLRAGTHSIKFNAKNGDPTKKVIVRLNKLGTLDHFNSLPAETLTPFETTSDNVLLVDGKERAYYCGSDGDGDAIAFSFTTDVDAEYELVIMRGNMSDQTTIANIEIVSGSVTASGRPAEVASSNDFGGYYRYNNRLGAQWNFDQCDGFRFNTLNFGNGYWEVAARNMNENTKTGDISYVYTKAIGNVGQDLKVTANFAELTYDGVAKHKIPVTAGLLFNAPANTIQMKVTYTNGIAKSTHLVVGNGVNMLIPYVENTYRADNDVTRQAIQPTRTTDTKTDNVDDFVNCVHHWKRDILYMSVEEGNVWDRFTNTCLDDENLEMFGSGGDETVNGVHFYKLNYTGSHGVPCVMRFTKPTSFNRIGVNRNLTYSFYTEYMSDLDMDTPEPRVRIVGTPNGLSIANIGDNTKGASAGRDYSNAIAFTYGGWKNSEGGNSYTSYDNRAVTDSWGALGVFSGASKGDNGFLTWADMANPANAPVATTDSPIASDGFPVISMNKEKATSGSLMPDNGHNTTDEFITVDGRYVPNYHPLNDGKVYLGSDKPYRANITPWSLPVRGAYLKFEPKLPGVLNVHILQQPNAVYYIADEFGIPQGADDVFTKTASSENSVIKVTADGNTSRAASELVAYKMSGSKADYVKYSFNVYPGKTYYMFSNDKGMGFAGFYYEPFVIRKNVSDEFGRWDVGVDEVSLASNVNYTYPTLPKSTENDGVEVVTSPGRNSTNVKYEIHYSPKAVKVTLNRSFKKNTWNSICLPYSMNQVQMEQIFGEGTRVVLLRDLQDKEHSAEDKITLTLICHEHQDILAGYPYFILPTKDVSSVTSYACLDLFPQHTGNVPSLVTVKSVGPNTNFYKAADSDYTYGGIDELTFKGTFSNAPVRDGSYYVGSGLLKKLKTNDGQGSNLQPYRAWIDLNEDVKNPAWAKKIGFIDGMPGEVEEEDDNTTGISIDALLEDNGIFSKSSTVYGINGQVVRKNALNLNELPKGIYVVNGKKYIVK